MEEESKEKLARIKNEYDLASHACNLKVILGEKREVIDHNIEALEASIRAETLKMHRDEAAGKEVSGLGREIAKNLEILKSVRDTRRQLDEKLDEYERFSEEMLRALQEELVQAILACKPTEAKNYRDLENSLERESILLECAESLNSIFGEIGKLLDVITFERSRVKRGWLFGYIFGRNPNFAITASLKAIAELASGTSAPLEVLKESNLEREDITVLSAATAAFSERLKGLAALRWGWKKIDLEVLPLINENKELESRWEKTARQAEEAAEGAAKQLDQWIERNAR